MFAIGDEEWAGVSKLVEECGETLQVFGKLMGTRGQEQHWDGSNLRERAITELADLAAAIEFVVNENLSTHETSQLQALKEYKLARFREWHNNQPEVRARLDALNRGGHDGG